ncbi:MAG TPA: ubiquinone/menaquinone biosynthesis methyltransferase [Acidimicrobiia bacterium]|nr:ubiquinone/menaquinone biosynthesis methyltransferase [Acidimicrobiia bacterium]
MSARRPHGRGSASVLPAPADKARRVEEMFDRIAPRYDRLNRLLTFRLDVGWRRRAVRSLRLPPSARVLDVACGTGDLCNELDRQGLRPFGVDFSAGMLHAARTDAPLVRADALRLPVLDHALDGVVCGFALRNLVALEPFFAECARVVRPGGRVALLDVAEPDWKPARAVHGVYFRRVVPFVGGRLGDRTAYRYLPESTAYLPSGPQLVARLTDAGFVDVERTLLGFGAAQLLTGTRR